MGKILLSSITMQFTRTKALDCVDLEIRNGEFFVILGPSGAGKTTLLKLVAGLLRPTQGQVFFDDCDVTDEPPEKRNVAMTFEQYALYPNYSVFDNIAHPLRAPRVRLDAENIKKRVQEVAEMLKIGHLLDRLPRELSGGQKQRVSLARAMVRQPMAFLLDEPLSHVDAKIRQQMRVELNRLQNEVSTTTIYVTHDYQEALALGDRIAILNHGKIVQIGTGEELYYNPVNEFVASLIGQPQINIIPAQVTEVDGALRLVARDELFSVVPPPCVQQNIRLRGCQGVILGIRGQYLHTNDRTEGAETLELDGKVYVFESFVTYGVLRVNVGSQQLAVLTAPDADFAIDASIKIGLPIDRLLYFDQTDGSNLGRLVQQERG